MLRVIIFGNSHHNTLGLVRSLGERGVRPILLLEPCDLRFCYVRFSKYIAKIHYLKTLEDGLTVLRNEYWSENDKPLVLVAGDAAMCMLDGHYDELKEHFHMFNARGEQGRINFFMDKANQFPVAERCGINLIKTWRIKPGGRISRDITYPCLTKGNNSTTSSKSDMYICRDKYELQQNLPKGIDCLVQEYIDKDYELNVIGLSFNHGEQVQITATVRKLRDYFNRQSVYVRLDNVADYPNLNVDGIKAFIKEVGYEGIFSLEFLCKGGKYYFLEANFRNDACAYVYSAAGINYPYLWVKSCVDREFDLDVSPSKTPFYMIHEDDLYDVFEGKVGAMQWTREYISADAHVYMNIRDINPFLFYVYVHVRQALEKVLRIVHVCQQR